MTLRCHLKSPVQRLKSELRRAGQRRKRIVVKDDHLPLGTTSFLSWRKRAGVRAVPAGSHSSHFPHPLSEGLDLEA